MKKQSFIVSSSKIRVEHILSLTTKGTWALSIVILLIFGGCIIASLTGTSKYEKHFLSKMLLPQVESPSLERIGKGPLSLIPLGEKSLLPDLSDEVMLSCQNTKPVRDKQKGELLLSLRSSKEQYMAKSGELVFLSCDPVISGQAPTYHFSKKKTPLWIRPAVFDAGKVLIEACHFSAGGEGELAQEEKVQFVLKEAGEHSGKLKGVFFDELKRVRLWGSDVLLAQFGGQKYKALKNKVKIEIPGRHKKVYCFVGVGDLLCWKEQGWHPVTKEDQTAALPLAQVISITGRSMELKAWDPEGFVSSSIYVDKQGAQKIAVKGEGFLHSIRLRTSTQVSCVFGKKHCLMREGDWILKTDMGIRNLKRAEDIDNYLKHKLIGELFVFDSLVEEPGGCVLKGFWIDKMRTQSIPCAVPVSGNAKNKVTFKKEKKSPFMKKSSDDSVTYFPEVCMQEERGK